jgi:squalene synthase HpnC
MNMTSGIATMADTHALLERGWSALPPDYRPPAVAPNLAEAQAWCRRLAESHYENFHVASWFLPERLRPHFHSIYAYCRVSDDLGDETGDPAASLALLDYWGRELDACYRGQTLHPVFVALADTIRACDIPQQPFADLLTAFRQDQAVTRYPTLQDLLGYCRYSANPVGRLVLYVSGYRDPQRFALSDHTCSALQLANFWQDVRVDYAKDRIYLPLEDMAAFGVTEETIASGRATDAFRHLLARQVAGTRAMFAQGAPLIGMVDRELAIDLDLFTRGGLEILRAIQRRRYDVLSARPSISRPRKAALLLRALAARWIPGLSLGSAQPA